MDKRKLENERVKKSIQEGLFTLIKKKKFSEITVTDIVQESGVARASYYRNFDSKENIIESYIARLHEEVGQKLNNSDDINSLFTHENLVISLEYYLKRKYYILQLYNNGFGTLIQEEINRYAEEALGDMPSHSIKRYELYFISGAMFNMIIQWLKTGAEESPSQMADAFLEYLSKFIKN